MDVPLLRPLLEKIDRQYVKVKGKKLWYNVIETPWINVKNNNVSRQARIFRNIPCLRYVGEVHEQWHALAGGYRKVYFIKTPAIYHTGYVWFEDGSKEKKGERNFEVARKAFKKSPDCSKLQLYAAEALMLQGI
nr:hypothetical protein [Sporomusa ovata]